MSKNQITVLAGILLVFLLCVVWLVAVRLGIESTQATGAIAVLAGIAGAVMLRLQPPGSPPPALVLLFGALLVSPSVGCAGSFEESRASMRIGAPPPSQRCIDLDDRHAFYGGVSKTSAVLAGGSGLSTIATDDPKVQMGLAIGSATMGAVAAGAGFVSESAADSWARECAQ